MSDNIFTTDVSETDNATPDVVLDLTLDAIVDADADEEQEDEQEEEQPWMKPGSWYVVHTQSGYEKRWSTTSRHASHR